MNEMHTLSKERQTSVNVKELPRLGYGNPDAAIKYERVNDNKEQLDQMIGYAVETINSGGCMVEPTKEDDGCIDGRTTVEVTYIDVEGIQRTVSVEVNDGHERQKVAGGGYLTGLAMEIALRPPKEGIESVLRNVVETLGQNDIFCGLHTGTHGKPEYGQTDCGANDKFQQILETGLRYRSDIAKTTQALVMSAGANYYPDAQHASELGWEAALADESFFRHSNGETRNQMIVGALKQSQVVAEAKEPLAVSKKLIGDHNERIILANFQEGKTFSQQMLRETLKKQFPDVSDEDLPQVFVVDVPRIVELAQGLATDSVEYQVALQAGIAYQLATASTLTDGSLRVFAVS